MKPTRTTPRHRHLVAAPLMVLALFAVSFFDAHIPAGAVSASTVADGVVTTGKDSKQFSTSEGITAIAQPYSSVSIGGGRQLTLLRGSVLARTTGIVEIDLGFGVKAHAIDGAFIALRDDASVSVVALTSAVLVSRENRLLIVPVGKQLRMDPSGTFDRVTVPSMWFSDQVSAVAVLPETQLPSLTEAQHRLMETILSDNDAVRSQDIRKLSEDDRLILLSSIVSGDGQLSASQTNTALDLAASFELDGGTLQAVTALRLISTNERMETGAGAAPADALAGTLTPAEFIYAVPEIALSSLRPVSSELIDHWSEEIVRSALSDAPSMVKALHGVINDVPQTYEDAGYPEQATLWRTAVSRISTSLTPLLSIDDAKTLAFDVAAALVPHQKEAAAAPVALPPPVPAKPQFTDDQLIAFTRKTLLLHDVLFSTNTLIAPSTSDVDCARVTGVFLSQNGRDVPYQFSVCPGTSVVKAIEHDGKRFPNSVPIDRFFP